LQKAFAGSIAIATIPNASELYLVDSSGWIEVLGGGPKADTFAQFLEPEENLLVPSVVVYEVQKKLTLTSGKTVIDRFLSHALRARVVGLDWKLASIAAGISIAHRLAMADAIIYATAREFGAQLITADPDFGGLPGVIIP
jgi:predicted nucleic acid-binding protein